MDKEIVIVSGLPRSGTSMMMRMLEAGGLPPMTDAVRTADADNPRGYFEYEPVKRLDKDASWMGEVGGRALKVVSLLLEHLPDTHRYAVLFMNRNIEEVLASQRAMLLRRVQQGDIPADAANPERLEEEDNRLRSVYVRHLEQTRSLLADSPNIRTLYVAHRATMDNPAATAAAIAGFLDRGLDVAAMTTAVEPGLYRQRV